MKQTRCYGQESRNLALEEEISINVILMHRLKHFSNVKRPEAEGEK